VNKILTYSLFLMLLTSCELDLKKYYGREGMFTPRPDQLEKMPQGNDPYSKGVRDGCNTAMSVVGTGPMAGMYEDSYYDFEKTLKDSDYYRGRTTGFNYCTYYQDVDPF
jgi:hypothetical protein